MNSWAARQMLLVLVATAACREPQAQFQTQTTPASTPAPVAEPAPRNEAIARADALLEDLKRREAAQAKFDRENPLSATPKLPPAPAPRATPAATVVTVAPPAATDVPAAQVTPSSPTAHASARDETWWKQQRQSLQRTLDEALARLAEAEKENYRFAYNDLQAEYKKRVAAVAEARLAIDRLHDEARRAGVPPAWLR